MNSRLSHEDLGMLYARESADFKKNTLYVAEMLLKKGYGRDQILGILSLYLNS